MEMVERPRALATGAQPRGHMAVELPSHSSLSLFPSLPSALQGPELWPEENLGDQELAAVLVSWMGPLILRLSHALERSPTPWFQQTPCLP